MIPYGQQSVSQGDVDAVVAVLKSEWLTQGPVVPAFERAVAELVGAEYGVATNSGTSALHLACLAMGLTVGDRLWTAPNTFVASANCGLYCGADVDFVDIDPATYNLSVPSLQLKLEAAARRGQLPKVLVPVHFAGQPTDQEAIWRLAREYGVRVVEDACHSLGAYRNGEAAGSCRWSDITVFSFHPVKAITSAEGGMAVTNDPDAAQRMRRLRTHGIVRPTTEARGALDGDWYYEQVELGFNYRISDIHCALGLSQLRRLGAFIARRQSIAARYSEALSGLPLTLPWEDPAGQSAWHLYVVRVPPGETAKSRRDVFDEMRAQGVGVQVHYIPVHLQPYYRRLGFGVGDFPEAERYYSEAISLPIFPSLSHADQETVITSLQRAIGGQ